MTVRARVLGGVVLAMLALLATGCPAPPPAGADVTPPVLELPGDLTATAVDASGADVTWTATATDDVDGDVAVECTPAPGTFPIGATQVTCSATDAAGNESTGTFTVTVAAPPEWVVSNVAGACYAVGYVDGIGADARFSTPASIAQGTDGTLYLADRTNNALRTVDPVTGAVSTFADGLDLPGGVAVDGDHNVYVSSNRYIKKISNGVVTEVDDSLLNRVADPFDVDEDGNLYFFRGVDLVRVDPNGVRTTLLAEVGGGSVAVDVDGTVYFQADHKIYRFRDGVYSFVAGSTQGFADGTGSDAQFQGDMGLDVFEGTVYVADARNNAVRTVSPAGVVTTIAGSSGGFMPGCTFGTGAEAQLGLPYGVVRDPSGDLYVAVGFGPLVAHMTQSP